MLEKRQEVRPFAPKLRDERTRLGMTQERFARLGGVSKATQVAYEAGHTSPQVEYLRRVAAAGVDVTWLVTDQAQPRDHQWELQFEIEDLIDEWTRDRGISIPVSDRRDLVRVLYGQFSDRGRIDTAAAARVFRLLKL